MSTPQHQLPRRTSAIAIITALTCLTATPNTYAIDPVTSAQFYNDIDLWLTTLNDNRPFDTEATNIAHADEVGSPPGDNTNVGGDLIFFKADTGLPQEFYLYTLQSGATFTFNDQEGGPVLTGFENALSVGDSGDHETDSFVFEVDPDDPPLTAFGIYINDNQRVAGESIEIQFASGPDVFAPFDKIPNVFTGDRRGLGGISARH